MVVGHRGILEGLVWFAATKGRNFQVRLSSWQSIRERYQLRRREVRPDSPQGLCLGGHRGNGQPGRALGLPGDLGEEAGSVGGGEGLGAEVVHDLQVVVDV